MAIRISREQAAAMGLEAPKRHKYGAKPKVVDGIRFDSTKEAKRYGELALMLRAGAIRDLRCHPVYDLHSATGDLVGKYEADFEYRETATQQLVTEDVKGVRTRLYKLKKKLFEAEYGRKITEI